MNAFVNIRKKQGSSTTDRDGALVSAVLLSHFGEWKVEGYSDALEELCGRKLLRSAVESIRCAIASRRSESLAELKDSGLFAGLTVLDRRGFWRVECEL